MVDVTAKAPPFVQRARKQKCWSPRSWRRYARTRAKGDVLAVARVAGIAAAKRTRPPALAHTIAFTARKSIWNLPDHVLIRTTVRTADRTGVEMEALTAASVAALTVVDMVRA